MREISKVIIYGGGIRGKRLCKVIWESGAGIEVAAVVDGNPKLWGKCCYGHVIRNPESVLENGETPVCIAVTNTDAVHAITHTLTGRYHYHPVNIIHYIPFLLELWKKRGRMMKCETFCRESAADPSVIFDFFYGVLLGGAESWAGDLCLGLYDRGWRNIHICANEDRFSGREIPPEYRKMMKLVDCLGNDPSTPSQTGPHVDTMQYLAEKMPCIIVTNFIETLCAACALKAIFPHQIRIISVIHSGHRELCEDNAKMMDSVDAYVAVSRTIQSKMLACGVEKDRVLLMRIPFLCEKNLEQKYTQSNSGPIKLGYAGRIVVFPKRIDLLLKLAMVLDERQVDFELEIAGAGDFEGSVRAFIAEHRLESQVRVIGQLPREEIPAFWKRQDVCVNISDFEGRSISITEAMGNGAVPVVTDVSGVRDDIVDGVNGFIVPVGGVEEMADRIEYLSNHRELLRPMGTAAHDEVYPKSLMEPHVQFWEELLTRMTDSLRT